MIHWWVSTVQGWCTYRSKSVNAYPHTMHQWRWKHVYAWSLCTLISIKRDCSPWSRIEQCMDDTLVSKYYTRLAGQWVSGSAGHMLVTRTCTRTRGYPCLWLARVTKPVPIPSCGISSIPVNAVWSGPCILPDGHLLPQVCLCINCILPLIVRFRPQVHRYTVVIHVLCCCKGDENSMRWKKENIWL